MDFKDVLVCFSKGEMSILDYYGYIIWLGFFDVVLELGRFCLDFMKGKELI